MLLAALSPLGANATETPRALVDALVRPVMREYKIAGMSVGLTIHGRPLVFNYGFADRQSAQAVTDSTLFEIGSVSKLFTATLAAWAQENGQLSWTDHPSRFLPSLKGTPIDEADLLQLGTFTAGGLPLQFPDGVAKDDAAVTDYFRGWKAAAPPGAMRQYSNPSLGLLGVVTAAAMGDNFSSLIETLLLPKFGMAHTFIRVPARAAADYAWGERDGQQVRVHPGPLDDETYGIKSSASDMLRFIQGNIDPGRLEPRLRLAVEATQVGYFSVGPMVQGLGWEQYPWPSTREQLLRGNSETIIFGRSPVQALDPRAGKAARLFDKTGSTSGFGAYVVFVPSQELGLVILANKNWPIPARVALASSILRRLAPAR